MNCTIRRLLTLVMAVLLLCTAVACSAPSAGVTDTTAGNVTSAPAPDTTTEAATTEKEYTIPDLYYDSADYTILVCCPVANGVNPFNHSDTRLVLDNAVYMRNAAVAEDLGVVFDIIFDYSNDASGNGAGTKRINADYTTQDGAYDSCLLTAYDCANLATTDKLSDLLDMPYMDMEMSYWDQNAKEQLAINNKLYFTTGDISYNDKDYTFAVIFNKQLAKENSLGDLYSLVSENKWTFDAFAEASRTVSEDLNGDDVMDSRDKYGLILWDDTMLPMVTSSGQKIITLKDGVPELTLNTETTANIVEKYVSLAKESCAINFQHTTGGVNWQDMFIKNQGLFLLEYFKALPLFRDTKLEYGLLPFPKYDENQEQYYSGMSVWHTSFYCVPAFPKDLDRSGAVSESLAYYSEKLVTPAYYEKTLVGRYVTDAESGQMLDLIFDNRIFDLGLYYRTGNLNSMLILMLRNKTSGFASEYAKKQALAEKGIEDLKGYFNID